MCFAAVPILHGVSMSPWTFCTVSFLKNDLGLTQKYGLGLWMRWGFKRRPEMFGGRETLQFQASRPGLFCTDALLSLTAAPRSLITTVCYKKKKKKSGGVSVPPKIPNRLLKGGQRLKAPWTCLLTHDLVRWRLNRRQDRARLPQPLIQMKQGHVVVLIIDTNPTSLPLPQLPHKPCQPYR